LVDRVLFRLHFVLEVAMISADLFAAYSMVSHGRMQGC